MATFLTKVQGILDKPLVRKVTGSLLEDLIPKIRARVGEDPIVALGGLATFLTWLAGRLPAKVAGPVRGVVALLTIAGAKATVTPTGNPKVVLVVPLPVEPAPASATAPGGKAPGGPKPPKAQAAQVVKVTVPLVPAARDQIQNAVSGAVDKLKRRAR